MNRILAAEKYFDRKPSKSEQIMRKRNNIFPGMLLIVVGVIFLGFNYNLIRFDYTFRQVASFWPLLLILGGLAVLFNERRSFYNPVTALLVAFAIPLAIYSFASDGVDDIKSNLKKEFDFNFEDKWDGEDYSQSSKSGERIEQDFEVPYSPLVERVKLKIGGGAAEFHLAESEKGIFEAKTMLNAGTYRLSEELKDGFQDIDFEMKGHKRGFRFSDGDWHNEVYLKLSKKPVWELELGIGAGDLTFDLSGHKVDKLEIKTGAAAVDVKLGDLMKESKVKIESGVAKVKLAVPKEVGCEIEMDGALNSKDFEGFNKVSGSRYQTDNFDTSEKKIFIKVSSGLSAVTVSRY